MESIQTYLKRAAEENASDLFISAGKVISIKKGQMMMPIGKGPLQPEQAAELVRELYDIGDRPIDRYEAGGDDDFSVAVPGVARFRVNAHRQRGTMAAIIRVVRFGIPDSRKMGIPEEVMRIADIPSGLVLVTGPAGSGKSTTLACVINAINHSRSTHIVTIEDPIEYLHRDIQSYITQREVAVDTKSYAVALRASLRQASNVILLEELDCEETIRLSITAAESGHLVLTTLHTLGVVNTIEYLLEQFQPAHQPQIRLQLSKVLTTVVSQQLLPTVGGGSIPAFEIAHLDNAVRGMIREGHMQQIDSVIRDFAPAGVIGMDASILRLYRAGRISRETALQAAMNGDALQKRL